MVRNGHAYAFVTDDVGSVTALIDTSGITDATYAYDPYGNQVSETGGEANDNLLGYTGALTDRTATSAGYTHLGNRWQDPATATFTQQDTLSLLGNPANGNRYAYAADNPTNNTDPTGQCTGIVGCGEIFGFWGAVGGAIVGCVVAGTFTGGIGCIPGAFILGGDAGTAGAIIGVTYGAVQDIFN